MTHVRFELVLFLTFVLAAAGCTATNRDAPTAKLPRPVSVIRLAKIEPSQFDRLTGSVGSWKTEQLGFEVGGRLRYVIEPETDVQGEIVGLVGAEEDGDANRVPLTKGQVLARLDNTRYRLAVKSVQAQIQTATQQKRAVFLEVTKVIPAQQQAAAADLAFRKSDVDRNRPLAQSGAVSQAEFDKLQEADFEAATAALAQVDASKQVKQAEEASLQAKIDELGEALAQAERDVADCEMRAPFRGQVAQVHVIPGGVVQKGQPVVTVQMMDPIKVDLEVSAATSRSLNYRDVVDVIAAPSSANWQPAQGGQPQDLRLRAFVYTTDPVADPATRTFTVTLLLRNKKLQLPAPAELGSEIVRTRDTWTLPEFPHVKEGATFVEANSIHSVGEEHYVWKIVNWEQVTSKDTNILEVAKVKVIPGEIRLDWFGLWTFREVAIAPGEDFDVQRDFVAGELDTKTPLQGGRILLDRQQWQLRPGDLVDVDLSAGRSAPGFYVPMDAIHAVGDKSFVFVVDEGRAIRIEVRVLDGPNTLKRIEVIGDQKLATGTTLVAGGVHYLTDGEAVNVVSEVQVQP